MTTLQAYQEALDFIYSTFMRVKDRVKGRYDREVRVPRRVVDLAEQLGVVPDASRTVRITGSKGKGTTSRATAACLSRTMPTERIALLVSPEEVEHTDRMRINGEAISRDALVRILNDILPLLLKIERTLKPDEYISPSGIFLLVGLTWFKEMDARYFVLETGRGALFDEVGNLRSKVSVVTSILLEHADKLGPGLEDIAKDKLSISASSETLIVPTAVHDVIRRFPSITVGGCTVVAPRQQSRDADLPGWLETDLHLARTAAAALVERPVQSVADVPHDEVSAAFVTGSVLGIPYALEALISLDSIDGDLLDRWINRYPKMWALASFPDDKDRERLIAYLAGRGAGIIEVVLEGTRGYLHYERAMADPRFPKLVCRYDDVAGFAAALHKVLEQHRPSLLYLAGTQTFVRLARQALAELRP